MPFPVELYVGHKKTMQLLLFTQQSNIKLFNPLDNQILMCKPMSKLQKLDEDKNSSLLRLVFQDLAPLIFYSTFKSQIFAEILNLKQNKSNVLSGNNYVTRCQISSQTNPFESQSVQIQIDFGLNKLYINEQQFLSQNISNLIKTQHELIIQVKLKSEAFRLKFSDFVDARGFFTVISGFLQFNDFGEEEVNVILQQKLGSIITI